MSLYNIEKILKPESVAVIGATDREGAIGRSVIENLKVFEGSVYPINPKKREILGMRTFPTLSSLEEPVDLAVICTPIATVPDIMEECAQCGVGGAVIISAGGKEVGREGALIEKRIKEIAHQGGIRVVGPNCMGVVAEASNLNASFVHSMPLSGSLAFISQSGAVCASVLDFAAKEKIGFSHFISIGSMLDVNFGDLIDYLGLDPKVSSILLYIEGVVEPRGFLSAARAVSRIKPIVVLKSGRSDAGAKAAQSHTGSLAGADAVYDAAFKRAGIVRVETLEDLFGCAELMAKQPKPMGPNLAIITTAGGPGVMAADYLARYDMEPAPLRPDTIEKINKVAPSFWSHGNPIDLTGSATIEMLKSVGEICIKAEEFDAILFMTPPVGNYPSEKIARELAGTLAGRDCAVFAVLLGGLEVEPGRKYLNDQGIPTYPSPEGAIRAFYYLYNYERNLKLLQEIPKELSKEIVYDRLGARTIVERALEKKRGLLTEMESKSLLSSYGIPINRTIVATTALKAVQFAHNMGYPVVAKVHSNSITHKSDAGGIRLDLRNADEVIDAFEEIEASVKTYDPDADFGGVTIQEMIKEKGYEVIVGSKQDPDFGPVILFGMGGVMTELLKDRAIGLPPLNRLLARRIMEETKVYRLLRGYRGQPGVNLELLEEILVRISQLVTDLPEIAELDINPLIMTKNDAYAVDARVVIKPNDKPAPMHLAISSYPYQYEMEAETRTGLKLFIRPIRPEDGPMLVELFENMSEETICNRFLANVKTLGPEVLARFTQIDYDRDLAMVAIDRSGERPLMVGLTRFTGNPDGEEAEWVVVVGDPWQRHGVATLLVDIGIEMAKKQGLKRLWARFLPGNKGLIRMAERIGASFEPIEKGEKYLFTYDVKY